MKPIIPFVHHILKDSLEHGSTVVDATLGNAYDTVFLSEVVGDSGRVIAFEIQQQAIEKSKKHLRDQGIENVTIVHRGHEHAHESLEELGISRIDGAIFNLGFLPGGDDPTITTTEHTTIPAIEQLLELLTPGGYIALVVYPGHPEGALEKEALTEYLKGLPANRVDVYAYKMVNRSEKAPFAYILEKKITPYARRPFHFR